MRHPTLVKALCLVVLSGTFALGHTAAYAQDAPLKFTLFGQPSPNNDAVWMAIAKGFYKQEGLDITYRLFPSGTTAFQTFQTGQGDIVLSGDLPSVRYFERVKGDYRTIAVVERDTKGYVAVASKDIKKPQDLVGKTIATRVGSTGSWFISEYLTKNKIDPKSVTVKNLDTQILPTALCGGDIAAFFIWQPAGSRALEICPDKVHYLTDSTGYMQGYLVAGARPEWLASKKGKEIATRWLRATIKGAEVAKKDPKAVVAYGKATLGLSEKATHDQWEINKRPFAIDKVYYDDFCSLSRWGRGAGALTDKIDFSKLTWTEGLKAIDPSRVDAPPPPC
jgi:ABC-type nitrate/sulfonate/bicarbonate transport system substrate-binding protein